jgi:hypothetical protein
MEPILSALWTLVPALREFKAAEEVKAVLQSANDRQQKRLGASA